MFQMKGKDRRRQRKTRKKLRKEKSERKKSRMENKLEGRIITRYPDQKRKETRQYPLLNALIEQTNKPSALL